MIYNQSMTKEMGIRIQHLEKELKKQIEERGETFTKDHSIIERLMIEAAETPEEKAALLDKPLDSMRTSYREWKDGKRVPLVKYCIALCNVLNCDMDYLLGVQKEYRKDVITIEEATGLSPEAARTLTNLPEDEKKILDYMLTEHGGKMFNTLMFAAYVYFHSDFPFNQRKADKVQKEIGIRLDQLVYLEKRKLRDDALTAYEYLLDTVFQNHDFDPCLFMDFTGGYLERYMTNEEDEAKGE